MYGVRAIVAFGYCAATARTGSRISPATPWDGWRKDTRGFADGDSEQARPVATARKDLADLVAFLDSREGERFGRVAIGVA